MKKCLLISTQHSVFMEPTRQALIRAGVEVRFVDYRGNPLLAEASILRRVWGQLPVSVANRGFRYARLRVNQGIVRAAERYKPDFIFVTKGKDLDPATLTALGKVAVMANWYPETVDHWGGIRSSAPFYKCFFTFEPLVIELLSKEGIHNAHYLPFCADVAPDAAWPQENKEPAYNITFIGTYHPERSGREHILAAVAKYGLNIWGGRAWEQTSLKQYYRGPISNEDMLKAYRSSRIVINHYITGRPGSGINLRPFEVTGAGALLINHDERSDIFRHFRDGEEFASFHGIDDIAPKIAYYVEHDQERRHVANQGFLRTRREHTYDIRMAEVLRVMNLS